MPVDIMDLGEEDKREDWIRNKHMKAFNLVNPQWAISEIDIVIDSPVDYEKGHELVNYIVLQGISIPVVSIDDLIKMKEKTGRLQDNADIRYLRELKDEKK